MQDQYFATTDKNGFFSAELNLDENCPNNMVVTAYAIIDSDTVAYIYGATVPDTIRDTLKGNLKKWPKPKNDTGDFQGYTFGIHTKIPEFLHSGEFFTGYCTIKSTTDNNDTINFLSNCRIKTQLVTSSGKIVYSNSIACGSRVLHLEKDSSIKDYFTIDIPDSLQYSYPDFAKDRKLSLIVHFNVGSDISDTVSFMLLTRAFLLNLLPVPAVKTSLSNKHQQ